MTKISPPEDHRPGWRPPVQGISDESQGNEQDERTTPAVAVTDPAPRVLVDTVQEILAGSEQADRRDRRAQRLEILRDEALPEVFPQREQERGSGDRDDIALEAERLHRPNTAAQRGTATRWNMGLDTIMKLLFHDQP